MTDRNTQPNAAAAGSYSIGGELSINRLGFGAMRLCGSGIWGEPEDPEAARAVLRRVLELGINLIDTADAYGPEVNEWQIAEALTPTQRTSSSPLRAALLDRDETSGCPKDGLSIYAERAREALGACAWSA